MSAVALAEPVLEKVVNGAAGTVTWANEGDG